MNNSQPTLDQRRAKHAWQAVEGAKRLDDSPKKDFAREAKRLPIRIKTAGLGQALAFLRAKGHTQLLLKLGDWILAERQLASAPNDIDENSLIQTIIEGDADLLRRATEEALLYLQWLTRFSEAELGTGE